MFDASVLPFDSCFVFDSFFVFDSLFRFDAVDSGGSIIKPIVPGLRHDDGARSSYGGGFRFVWSSRFVK